MDEIKNDSAPTVTCDNCGEEVGASQQKSLPDNGWWLPFEHFGYYGGFTDEIEVLMGQRDGDALVICHDCVVRMLHVLPGIASKMRKGNHINTNRGNEFQHPLDIAPCCEWCWTTVRNGREPAQIYVVEDGKWISMRKEHTKSFFDKKRDADDDDGEPWLS